MSQPSTRKKTTGLAALKELVRRQKDEPISPYTPPIKLHVQHAPRQATVKRLSDREVLDLMERVRSEFGDPYALRVLEELIEDMRRKIGSG